MSSLQFASLIGIPLTVLLVAVALIALTRPDPDAGIYPSYLALASLLSLYLLLLGLAATGEAIAQHLVWGDGTGSELGSSGSLDVYFSLFTNGGGAAIAAFGTLTAAMAAVFTFHQRRRTELLADAIESHDTDRIDRAYRASVCFAMISLAAIGTVVAGSAGYNFVSQPVAAADVDKIRDLAMGTLLSYGGLVLVTGLIFRANVWAIRGDRAAEPEPDLAGVDEA